MKIHERWQQHLGAKGIQFDFTILKGKYPHQAQITFSDGDLLSFRGRRIGNEYHLLPSETRYLKNQVEKLPYFSLLLQFFKEFLQDNEAVNTLLIRDIIFSEDTTIVKEHGLIFLNQISTQTLKKLGLIQNNYAYYYVPFKENGIISIYEMVQDINEWGTKAQQEHPLFSLRNQAHLGDHSIGYHYMGHNGNLELEWKENKITIIDKKLSFSSECTIDTLKEELDIFLEEVEKKQKIRRMFSNETYFLESYLGGFYFHLNIAFEIKRVLLEEESASSIEEKAASFLKTKKDEYRRNVTEDNIQLAEVLDYHFVLEDGKIIFYSKEPLEAVEIYENTLLERLEKNIRKQKERIALSKAHYLNQP